MTVDSFIRTYTFKWADLDMNGHLPHSAYIDIATDTQFAFAAERGYGQSEFEKLNFGPVILRLDVRFYREVGLEHSVTDSLIVRGQSPDWARWKTRHEITRSDGESAARVNLEGTWLDLQTRQAIEPPDELKKILDLAPRAQNVEELRSFVRGK